MQTVKDEFRSNLFSEPCFQFIEHLQRPDNIRIVFSGRFGIGKTYFLDHFFKDDTQKERLKELKYRPFHIYPINYSISTTEDIFKYLKYDVLSVMLVAGISIQESDYKLIDTYPTFLDRNIYSFLGSIIKYAPKVGVPADALVKIIRNLKNDFFEQGKTLITSDGDKAVDFLELIERAEGSIYEDDFIAQVIAKTLQRTKAESGLENILIIDDLDRIDPEHLFRILNVFSAHLGPFKEKENKLGFDKVIVVCDVQNLRSIFRAKYGIDSDFNGYIDKFYSYDVFHLDNKSILSEISEEAFRNVDFGSPAVETARFMSMYFRENSLAIEILQQLVGFGLINLRSLMAVIKCRLRRNPHSTIAFPGNFNTSSYRFPILFGFSILRSIVGGYDNLKEMITKIPPTAWKISNKNSYCNQLLYFSNYQELLDQGVAKNIPMFGVILTCPPIGRNSNPFENVVVVDGRMPASNATQYDYSKEEFVILLKSFIDVVASARQVRDDYR